MKRITLIKNQLNNNIISLSQVNEPLSKNYAKREKEYISSAYDYLDFDEFLTPSEKEKRKKLRIYLQEMSPKLNEYYEKQEFPMDLIRKFFSDFPGLIAMHLKGYGSAEISFWFGVAVILEISRVGIINVFTN